MPTAWNKPVSRKIEVANDQGGKEEFVVALDKDGITIRGAGRVKKGEISYSELAARIPK